MANFIDRNINQTVLLDVSYLKKLGTNTFVFYLYTLLEEERGDLVFMSLAVGTKPHFSTISNLVSGNCETIKDLFHKVLLVCSDYTGRGIWYGTGTSHLKTDD